MTLRCSLGSRAWQASGFTTALVTGLSACNAILGIDAAVFSLGEGQGGKDAGSDAARGSLTDPPAPSIDPSHGGGGTGAAVPDGAMGGSRPIDGLPEVECRPGERACTEDGTGSNVCVAERWQTQACAETESCDPAAEGGAACRVLSREECRNAPGSALCVGRTRVKCGATRFDVATERGCESERHCLEGAGDACAECVAEDPATCSGSMLSICQNNQRLTLECGQSDLCNQVAKRCDVCRDGEAICVGSELRRCNLEHTAFAASDQCESPLLCDQVQKECDVCVPNAFSCDGNARVRCSADGQQRLPAACPNLSPICQGAGDCVGCLQDDDCRGTTALCSPERRCVECIDASDCRGSAFPFCEPGGDCVECRSDADCSAGDACLGGLCI